MTGSAEPAGWVVVHPWHWIAAGDGPADVKRTEQTQDDRHHVKSGKVPQTWQILQWKRDPFNRNLSGGAHLQMLSSMIHAIDGATAWALPAM